MTGKYSLASWIIDTGASNHMTGNLKEMSEVHNITACPVGLPNGEQTNATKEGTVILEGGLKLKNVLYVSKLRCSLISVSQLLDDSNYVVQFTNKLCVMQDRISKTLIGAGKRIDGLYYFRGVHMVQAFKTDGVNHVDLWHKRLGHPSFKISKLIPELSENKCKDLLNKNCDICFRAKQSRDMFPLSEHKANNIFDLIHCDLWGPYKSPSSCGAFYFMTIVDDYSRSVWIYLLADKREVFQMLLNFFSLIKTQFDKHIKIFRSDNGTEFTCMKNYFFEHGIIFQTSCVGSPQQNGRVERKYRHILNVARALRFQANLPINF
uniref:Retrovirus-related Pol polyprotein from transposon TNT 1-94 n=1 Tax=Cajanus cajan TaxID=3821 RepID=A0A151T9A1_CAJCA|nr:Retrovirus-related Pol polyprotein from transposon TNT 1-94 [Cajanus cajan]